MLSFSDTLCEVHLDYHTEREAETSLLRFGFDSRPINVVFLVDKGTQGQLSISVCDVRVPVSCYQCSTFIFQSSTNEAEQIQQLAASLNKTFCLFSPPFFAAQTILSTVARKCSAENFSFGLIQSVKAGPSIYVDAVINSEF